MTTKIINYADLPSQEQFVIRHHIYTAAYTIKGNHIEILSKNGKIVLSCNDDDLIFDLKHLSDGAERDHFLSICSVEKPFAHHLRMYKKKICVPGFALADEYIKFYHTAAPSEVAYSFSGRTYIDYSSQLNRSNIIHDNPWGCGLSAGYIDRTFQYFLNYNAYGEKLMFIKPLPFTIYRKQGYELLGPRYRVIRAGFLSDPEIISYILAHMSDYAKEIFFQNRSDGHYLNFFFANIDEILTLMDSLGSNYHTAMEILKKEQKNWV